MLYTEGKYEIISSMNVLHYVKFDFDGLHYRLPPGDVGFCKVEGLRTPDRVLYVTLHMVITQTYGVRVNLKALDTFGNLSKTKEGEKERR